MNNIGITTPATLYKPSLMLLTDLYQLTMAYGYWKCGMADHEAVFSMSFRQNPSELAAIQQRGLHQRNSSDFVVTQPDRSLSRS